MALSAAHALTEDPWSSLAKSFCIGMWPSVNFKTFNPRDFIVRYQKNPFPDHMDKKQLQEAIYIFFYKETFFFKKIFI